MKNNRHVDLFKKTDWDEFLFSQNRYKWQDMIMISIDENISIERLVGRLFKELDKSEVKELVKHIRSNVKELIEVKL